MQDRIQRERGNSHRVQLQLREVNFLYAEGCRAALQSHWCVFSKPFLCIGGRAGQGHNSSKFIAAHLQELLQAEDKRTNREAFYTPFSTQPDQWAMAASPFAHDQPAVGSVWKRSKLSSQDMQGTNSSPIPSWAQVTLRPSVLCQVAVLFWRQPYTQKQVPLQNAVRDAKSKILSRTRWTLAWAQYWCCGGTWYPGACSTTLVRTKWQLGLQCQKWQLSRWQMGLWAEDCKTIATTRASTLQSPVNWKITCNFNISIILQKRSFNNKSWHPAFWITHWFLTEQPQWLWKDSRLNHAAKQHI